MRNRKPDPSTRDQRERAGGMERDPAMSGDKPELGRSMERDRNAIRPESPRGNKGQSDVIR
jgi:hypothetical protein